MQYYQAPISAETTTQGLRILDHLMTKQLAFGGPARICAARGRRSPAQLC
jgi:hypothetical protein